MGEDLDFSGLPKIPGDFAEEVKKKKREEIEKGRMGIRDFMGL